MMAASETIRYGSVKTETGSVKTESGPQKNETNFAKKKADSIKTVRRVLVYIRPYLSFVVLSLICAGISVACQLAVPIFCGEAIDRMVGPGEVDLAAVIHFIMMILAVIAAAAVAYWVQAICNNRITFRVSRDIRNDAIAKIQKLPLSYLDGHPSGDLVSRVIADVDLFSDGLLMGFTQLFTGILKIAGTICFMVMVNIPVTLVVVALTPLSLVVAGFIVRHTYRYFQVQNSIRGEQTAMINEQIEGLRIIQAFEHEDKSLKDFDEVNERLKNASLQAVFFSSLTNPSTRLVNNIVYAAVALAGSLFAIAGGISIGQLSVLLSYASQYAKPFNEISGVITELQNAVSCAARVFKLLDEEEEEPGNAEELNSDGNVAICNVSFSYQKEHPLIEDFSLKAHKGQRIAIVGPTGCGKTTMINLLMRFYDPDQGCIKVAGKDIRSVTRHSLRRNYGMVLQDTWLRRGTIRENISYGKPEASEEEVIQAAKKAHAHSFIKRLPHGYDTVITEEGGNISQGQKQLLCIARVMLCLPPMLILDEATSSIDTRTEISIQNAFAEMMKGRTSFVVAHRLSTIREADIILVMRDGHIVEQGNHEELIRKKGFYAELYNSQFADAIQSEQSGFYRNS